MTECADNAMMFALTNQNMLLTAWYSGCKSCLICCSTRAQIPQEHKLAPSTRPLYHNIHIARNSTALPFRIATMASGQKHGEVFVKHQVKKVDGKNRPLRTWSIACP